MRVGGFSIPVIIGATAAAAMVPAVNSWKYSDDTNKAMGLKIVGVGSRRGREGRNWGLPVLNVLSINSKSRATSDMTDIGGVWSAAA